MEGRLRIYYDQQHHSEHCLLLTILHVNFCPALDEMCLDMYSRTFRPNIRKDKIKQEPSQRLIPNRNQYLEGLAVFPISRSLLIALVLGLIRGRS